MVVCCFLAWYCEACSPNPHPLPPPAGAPATGPAPSEGSKDPGRALAPTSTSHAELTPNDGLVTMTTPTVLSVPLEGMPSPLLVLPAEQRPVPLIIGGHGAGGSPEWNCEWLSWLLDESAVLLCLRGTPMDRHGDSFYYPEHHSLDKWLSAALDYVKQQYTERLDGRSVYVAYSQGATMGALALQDDAEIPNLLLVEGGVDGWSATRSRRFAQKGGRRVYFACGTRSCHNKAKSAAVQLERANVEVRVHHAEGAGHTPGGKVGGLAQAGLLWLLEPAPEAR